MNDSLFTRDGIAIDQQIALPTAATRLHERFPGERHEDWQVADPEGLTLADVGPIAPIAV